MERKRSDHSTIFTGHFRNTTTTTVATATVRAQSTDRMTTGPHHGSTAEEQGGGEGESRD